MSIPHTGRLEARILGIECRFNGDAWTCADKALQESLNKATADVPKTHCSIHEIALAVFDWLDLSSEAEILNWEADAWGHDDSIPGDSID